MTKETVQFRAHRVLNSLESLAVRLEVVVGYYERKVAKDLEDEGAVGAPVDAEALKAAEEELEDEAGKRLMAAQQLADRVNSGEITEEEKEEYLGRWLRGPG